MTNGAMNKNPADIEAPDKPQGAGRGGKRPGAGRPKGSRNRATEAHKGTLEALARGHTMAALESLVSIARDGASESARVSAAVAILDRGYGKPRQAVEHTGEDGGPIQTESLSDREVAMRLAFVLTRGDANAQ